MQPSEITADRLLFDPAMGIHTVFMSVPRREWVFVKLLVESYEGIGVTRTLERHSATGSDAGNAPEPSAAFDAPCSGVGEGEDLMVLMAVPDMVETTVSVLSYLAVESELRLIHPNEAYRKQFREALLAELGPEGTNRDSTKAMETC